jgi:hypothetical protein
MGNPLARVHPRYRFFGDWNDGIDRWTEIATQHPFGQKDASMDRRAIVVVSQIGHDQRVGQNTGSLAGWQCDLLKWSIGR